MTCETLDTRDACSCEVIGEERSYQGQLWFAILLNIFESTKLKRRYAADTN